MSIGLVIQMTEHSPMHISSSLGPMLFLELQQATSVARSSLEAEYRAIAYTTIEPT